MSRFRLIPAALLLSVSLSFGLTAPALSQGLSSAELWAGWQADVTGVGGSLTATETREGNRLVLRDIRLQLGQAEGAGTLLLDMLTFVNRADGSVGIVLPETFPLRVQSPELAASESGPARPARELRFLVAAPGLELAILGIGEKSSFTARAPSLSVTLDGILPPLSVTEEPPFIALALADLNLRYAHELVKPAVSLNAELSLGTLHGEFRYSDAELRDVALVVDLAGGKSHIAGAVPPAAGALMDQIVAQDAPSASEFLAVLEAGAFFDGAVELGQLGITLNGMRLDQSVAAEMSLASILGKARLDKAGLGYDYGVTGLSISLPAEAMEGSPITGGVTVGLAEFSQMVKVGLNGLKGPQDWGYRLTLKDLTISDSLWNVFDLTGLLERKPMSLLVDLGGSYGIMPEALAPGWQPVADELPLDHFSFRLNGLNVDGLGIALTGQGGLDFDMKDLVSYEGMPAPRGALSFVTKGVYGLLDAFIGAGLLSSEEAMGFRGGLMMIGKAGADPDTLNTDLRFEGKSFWLNGMKMR